MVNSNICICTNSNIFNITALQCSNHTDTDLVCEIMIVMIHRKKMPNMLTH